MSTRRAATLPLAGFGLITLGVYATALTVVASPLFTRAPRLGAAAISFDLLVSVPAAFWLLVMRPRGLRWFTVVPVVIASGYAGLLVLPAASQQYLGYARFLTAPAELGLMGWGAVRAWRLLRSGAHPRGDVMAAIEAALGEIVRYPRVAQIVAAEVGLLWYALLSWRARPEVGPGEMAFTGHRRSGMMGLFGAVAFACLGEAVGVHLLAAQWNSTVAWVLTGLSFYSVLWLVGLARSILLRPTVVAPDGLHVRLGLLTEARIPFDRIAAVTEVRAASASRRAPGYLHAAVFAAPRVMIELNGEIEARGMYGMRKRGITRVGLLVDEPRQLAATLAERMPRAR
ncbi:hypothetical protein [Longimicrobium sp.]|uniref:hypothetical protein n=1 Tax=Longimicrobium sp. TaxID=2029185 RepID=UPI002C8F3ED0|nr:hypothetical protein [Longimicrobium sp.]HSU13013.1 hypothetical protein [Longimicrobium sp.]